MRAMFPGRSVRWSGDSVSPQHIHEMGVGTSHGPGCPSQSSSEQNSSSLPAYVLRPWPQDAYIAGCNDKAFKSRFPHGLLSSRLAPGTHLGTFPKDLAWALSNYHRPSAGFFRTGKWQSKNQLSSVNNFGNTGRAFAFHLSILFNRLPVPDRCFP